MAYTGDASNNGDLDFAPWRHIWERDVSASM